MGIEQVGANRNGSNGSFTVSLWVNGSTTTIINNGRDSQCALPRQAFSVDQEKSVGQRGDSESTADRDACRRALHGTLHRFREQYLQARHQTVACESK